MAEDTVVEIVRDYLRNLRRAGLEPCFAVLFGSNVTGAAAADSDIDVLVVSRVFDCATCREPVNVLWRVAARTDARLEPVACGEQQWLEDDSTPIIEAARRQGLTIAA